ncbi:MAG TPA: glycosyltransferase [Acidimicrobiia bacterium]
MAEAPVTVIVPVYRDIDAVTRSLEAVVTHAPGISIPFELLLIDDASPASDVRAYLDRFAARDGPFPVTLLRNTEQLGFIATVNRGLRRAAGDVVVLEADTAVTAGWLDRLAGVASEVADVASVTPLTNRGSICTLPQQIVDAFGLATPNPRVDECANFVAVHSLRLLPEIVTGVGFCTYITRRALDTCGPPAEEVDICRSATRLGLRHIVDDSTFVYHRGGGSVGQDTRERAPDAARVSLAGLELALGERRRGRTHILHIMHNEPGETGGTEKFLNTLMEALEDEYDFSVLSPVQSGFALQTRSKTAGGDPLVERFLLPGGPRPVTQVRDEFAAAALVMALDMFDYDAVHVHNLIGHSLSPLSVLAQFDGPVLCSVHDLFLACPNFSLLYRNVEPCGIPDDLSVCDRCLETVARSPMPGSPRIDNLSRDYLTDFRNEVRENLASVDHWVFATQSAADTFLRVYEPEPSRVRVIEHGSVIRLGRRTPEPDQSLIYDEPLRVAFVGLGWAKKGLDAVNELADTFWDTSIEIHHFGELKQRASFELHAHGPYDNEFLPELLHRSGVQIVLLPGPYAETFGIVMTEALVAGLPVVGATYGALGERIRATGAGWTIDPMNVDGMRALIARLDRARDEVMRATRRVRRLKLETVKDTAPQYAALYDSAQQRSHRSDTNRLRRHIRALSEVNAQLQAQLGSGGSRSIDAAARHPAGAWEPFLVRSHKRGGFVVEGSMRREIKGGILFAALARAIGDVREVRDSQLDTWIEGPPVEVLLAPTGPAFVVIGGRKRSIRGLPLPYQVATDEMLRFPVGPELLVSVPPPTKGARVRRVLRREGIWGAGAITARRAIGRLQRKLSATGLRAGTRARSRGES